jgi:hypothetical protein
MPAGMSKMMISVIMSFSSIMWNERPASFAVRERDEKSQ